MAKTGGREPACKSPRTSEGHPAGEFLEGKAMHVEKETRNAPGIVTIILHGAGVTVKRNIPAARCAARETPHRAWGPRRGCRLRAPTHSQN